MDTRVKVLSFYRNDSTLEYKIIQLSAIIAAEYHFADVSSNLCSSQEPITKTFCYYLNNYLRWKNVATLHLKLCGPYLF